MDQHHIAHRSLTLLSEGTRIAADVYQPSDASRDHTYPGVLFCHGWGGLKSQLAPYAENFARAGFVIMVFDYRGWGESDGRIIALLNAPPLRKAGVQTLEVQVLREVVDPVDQVADAANCLAALGAEDGVDPNRIGVWGTSFGAGHAVFLAGTHPSVRAVVAQVGGYGLAQQFHEHARQRTIEKVRGEMEPVVPQGRIDAMPNLVGTPDVARMLRHSPLAAARDIRVPTLILDVDAEELVDTREHGAAAAEIIGRNAVCEYRILPGRHYDIYGRHLQTSQAMALEWFRKYL